MSGLDLQEQMAAKGVNLPVIVITGFADVPMAVRAMRAGAVTFLEKPCGEQEIWDAIETALDAGSAVQRAATECAPRSKNAMRVSSPREHDVLERMAGRPDEQGDR